MILIRNNLFFFLIFACALIFITGCNNEKKAINLTRQAKLDIKNEKYFEAMDVLKEAINIKNDFGEAHHLLGMVYLNMGCPQTAAAEFKLATYLQPNDTTAYLALGDIYNNLGSYWESIKNFKLGLFLDPNNDISNNSLGVAYANLGLLREAIKAFQAAIRLNKDNFEAQCNLGSAYYQQGNYSAAIAAFNRAIKANDNYAPAYIYMGAAYQSLFKYEDAIMAYKKAIQIQPDNEEVKQYLKSARKTLAESNISHIPYYPGYETAYKFTAEQSIEANKFYMSQDTIPTFEKSPTKPDGK
jgi:tetratricopeptide (TPR) repeat protein